MAIIKNWQTTMLVWMWRKGSPFALLVGMQILVATVERCMEVLQKIKNGSAFWPSNPTSGNISKETQDTNLKERKHSYAHCSVLYNCQDMEAAQVSINRWMDKTTMEHVHNGILLGLKKKKMLPFAIVWMDLENVMLSEISQSGKDKYLSLIHISEPTRLSW